MDLENEVKDIIHFISNDLLHARDLVELKRILEEANYDPDKLVIICDWHKRQFCGYEQKVGYPRPNNERYEIKAGYSVGYIGEIDLETEKRMASFLGGISYIVSVLS